VFNSLSGEVSYKDEERLFLSSGAVEWEIHVSRNSSDDLPDVGGSCKVYVYLYHRDDQLRLYGFSEVLERDVFLDLLKVEGVGPRQALKILSGVKVGRFIDALETEDLELLSSPAGISLEEDILNALVGMGFDRRSAKSAVGSAARALRESDMSREELERELFKSALSQLSAGSQSSAGPAAGKSSEGPAAGA
jgi:Holliday junction DNA helicase RuvA